MSVTASNYHDGALDLSQLPRFEGYMYKKGGVVNNQGGFGNRRNWKRRWFVINPIEYRDKTAYELQYYDSPNGKLKGSVGLFDIELYCETKSLHRNVKYEFQILLSNGGILQLSCDNSDEREEWIESLNVVISYLRKVLISSGYSLNGYDPIFEDEENIYKIGDEIASLCHAFGPGLVGAEAGMKTHFLIQVNDINGQPTTEGGMPITATISDNDHLFYVKVLDNKDGTYSGFYTIGLPGTYDLHICLNDEHDIHGSPFPIEILASKTTSELCIADGNCLSEVTIGTISHFTIYSRDTYGNNKTKGGDPFEVNIIGPAQLQGLIDNNDGTYSCSFEAKNPTETKNINSSSLMVSVTLFGKHIAGSPFHPTIILTRNQVLAASNSYTRPVKLTSSSNITNTPQQQLNPSQSQQQQPMQIDDLNKSKPSSNLTKSRVSAMSINSGNTSQIQNFKPQFFTEPNMPNGPSSPQQSVNTNSQSFAPSVVTQLTHNTQQSSMSQKLQRIAQLQTGGQQQSSQQQSQPDQQPTSIPQEIRVSEPVKKLTAVDKGNLLASEMERLEASSDKPMSRLERARQRAMFAKKLTQDPSTFAVTDQMANMSLGNQASETDNAVSRQQPNLGVTNRRASVQRVDVDPITGLKINSSLPLPPPPPVNSTIPFQSSANSTIPTSSQISSPDEKQSKLGRVQLQGLTQQEVEDVVISLNSGMVGTLPGSYTDEDKIMWDLAHKALLSSDVLELLIIDISLLKACFNLLAMTSEGIKVLKLTSSTNGGTFRLLQEFDIIPTYMSMKEAKSAFSLILIAQRNAKTASSMAGGGTGLDFAHFIKFLVMISVYCLSKTTAFSTVYKTYEAKVDCMLHKWGFADKLRIQMVRNILQKK